MKKKSNRTTADLTNPHDKFVREVWAREDVTWDFLSRYLPPTIANRLVPAQPDGYVLENRHVTLPSKKADTLIAYSHANT